MRSLFLLPFVFLASCATKAPVKDSTPPKAVVVREVSVAAPAPKSVRPESDALRKAVDAANDSAKQVRNEAAAVAERAAEAERAATEIFEKGLTAGSEEAKRHAEQLAALRKKAEDAAAAAERSARESAEARARASDIEREAAVLEANNSTLVDTLTATVAELQATRDAVGKSQDNARLDVDAAREKARQDVADERAARLASEKIATAEEESKRTWRRAALIGWGIITLQIVIFLIRLYLRRRI